MIRRGTREGPGAQVLEGGQARAAAALICAVRLRYFRSHAALRAGSRQGIEPGCVHRAPGTHERSRGREKRSPITDMWAHVLA